MKYILILIFFGLLLVSNIKSDFNEVPLEELVHQMNRIRKLCIGLGKLAGATKQQASYVCGIGGACLTPIVIELVDETSKTEFSEMNYDKLKYGKIGMQCYARACSEVLESPKIFGRVAKKAKILCKELKNSENTPQDFAKAITMLLRDELAYAKKNNMITDMINIEY